MDVKNSVEEDLNVGNFGDIRQDVINMQSSFQSDSIYDDDSSSLSFDNNVSTIRTFQTNNNGFGTSRITTTQNETENQRFFQSFLDNKKECRENDKDNIVIGCNSENEFPLPIDDEEQSIFSNVRVTYNHPSNILQLEHINDFVYANNEYKLKRLIEFSQRNGGMLRNEIVRSLLSIKIENFKEVQYLTYRLLFPNYNAPFCKSDTIVISPTGTGKSLSYIIPMVQLVLQRKMNEKIQNKPSCVIFVPSQQIALYIKEELLKLTVTLKINVSCFTPGERNPLFGYDIGIFTFGTYKNRCSRIFNYLKNIKFIVIDEADAMVEDINISRSIRDLKESSNARVLLFSATVNSYVKDVVNIDNLVTIECGEINSVAKTVEEKFYIADWESSTLIQGYSKNDIKFHRNLLNSKNPFDILFKIINTIDEKPQKILVFVKRKELAKLICLRLTLMNVKVGYLHGDFPTELRNQVLNKFEDGTIDVLIGTRLISRGIDFDANHVINFDLPLTYKEYVHRCGRVGRNDKIGFAHSIIDLNNHEDYNREVVQNILKSIANKINNREYNLSSIPEELHIYMRGFI